MTQRRAAPMPSDVERRPARHFVDWLSPIPSDPDRDPYERRVPRERREEDKDRTSFEFYSRFLTATMDFITEFLDWSWFIAEWHGMPRWKWIVRVYVALLFVGPAMALFGWIVLGWYR